MPSLLLTAHFVTELCITNRALDGVLECCMPSLLLTAHSVTVAILIYSIKCQHFPLTVPC
jgi:hypothetical protein